MATYDLDGPIDFFSKNKVFFSLKGLTDASLMSNSKVYLAIMFYNIKSKNDPRRNDAVTSSRIHCTFCKIYSLHIIRKMVAYTHTHTLDIIIFT